MDLPLALICDLDSTLCDVGHRETHANKGDWKKFHSETPNDKPNEWCVEILEAMISRHPELEIFFITGRPEYAREDTEEWLHNHLSPMLMANHELYMRPDDDYKGRKNLEFKREQYRENIKGKYRVLFVLEDQVNVVAMWREEGLTCLQPEINDY